MENNSGRNNLRNVAVIDLDDTATIEWGDVTTPTLSKEAIDVTDQLEMPRVETIEVEEEQSYEEVMEEELELVDIVKQYNSIKHFLVDETLNVLVPKTQLMSDGRVILTIPEGQYNPETDTILISTVSNIFTQEEMEHHLDNSRDLTSPIKQEDTMLMKLANKVPLTDIFEYLPTDVLIQGVVWNINMAIKGEIVEVGFSNRFRTFQYLKQHNQNILETFKPHIPYKFYTKDTAYAMIQLLETLLDNNAIEIGSGVQLKGNVEIINRLDKLYKHTESE